jgi:radical SAM superfamily enzyme YgiQ (UPF0313 family)
MSVRETVILLHSTKLLQDVHIEEVFFQVSMRYEGPIYRPPSEANSLLIQATIGCPHNKCTFCMVYKKGPPFRVRSLKEIKEDLELASARHGSRVRTLFFPAGNTIAMPTDGLVHICGYAKALFPQLKRITTYGSSNYIYEKGLADLKRLKDSGLSRIHVGLESGDDEVLRRIKKGTTAAEQIQAGLWVLEAGIELSEYVILGIGGEERSREHVDETIRVLNAVNPDFIRLRTFLPKINTLLFHQIQRGRFRLRSAHGILRETKQIIEGLEVTSTIVSDHYTNYVNVCGKMPEDRNRMVQTIRNALMKDESDFRPIYVGTQ